MALMSSRSWREWLVEYAQSHQHPANRFCHTIGVPLVASSVALTPPSFFLPGLWWTTAGLFVTGWTFQFIGHAYERKPPEFTKDWRFLFVGLRWWVEKMRGRM
jgi:uncharacterized membrane protein YGL010W